MQFKGSLEECFAKYASLLPPEGTRSRARFYEPLMKFCGTSSATVVRWLRAKRPMFPAGIPLVKARFFFELIGWQVTDLLGVHSAYEPGYKLGELVALNVITLEQVREELVYSDNHAVLRLCHGQGVCTSEREVLLLALIADKATEVESRRRSVSKELHGQIQKLFGDQWSAPVEQVSVPATASTLVSQPRSSPTTAKTERPVSVNGTGVRLSKREALRMLAYKVLDMYELARAIARDATPEDRRLLREMTELDEGMHASFQLTSELQKILDMLCGEQARDHVLEQEQESQS